MSLGLQQLRIQAFRGVRSTLTVPFAPGFTVVCGRNGSGKSTIIDAIEFALTGKLRRYEGATEKREDIEDYLWWIGSQPRSVPLVEIQFADFADEHPPVIFRRGPDTFESPDPAALLDLELAPPNALDVLCKTSIIRDELINLFSVDMTESERYHFVRDAMGVIGSSLYEVTLGKHKELVDAAAKSIETDYNAQQQRQHQMIRELSAKRIDASKAADLSLGGVMDRYRELTGESASSLTTVSEGLTQHLIATTGRLSLLRELADVVAQLTDLEKQAMPADQFAKLLEQSSELADALSKKREQLKDVTDRLQLLRLGAPSDSAYTELAKYGEDLGLQEGHCPLCGSKVTANQFASHVFAIRDRRLAATKELENVLAERDRIHESIQEAEDKKEEIDQTILSCRAWERRMGELRTQCTRILTNLSTNAVPKSIDSEIEQAAGRIHAFSLLRTTIQSSQALDAVVALEQQLAKENEQFNRVATALAQIERLSGYVDAATKIVKRATMQAVEERLASLEPLLLEMYTRLRPHVEWQELHYRFAW